MNFYDRSYIENNVASLEYKLKSKYDVKKDIILPIITFVLYKIRLKYSN